MRKTILLSFLLIFSSVLVFSQEQPEYVPEPTGKETRKQRREARKAEYEAKKQEALEMIKGGDFVLVANQVTLGGTKKTRAFPTSNFVKVEGNIVYIQTRFYRGTAMTNPSIRMRSGEIQDIQVFDKGKGKGMKVRLRYGFRKRGEYGLVDIYIGNKTAQARLGMGRTFRLEGYYDKAENVFIDTTVLEMTRLRYIFRESETESGQ